MQVRRERRTISFAPPSATPRIREDRPRLSHHVHARQVQHARLGHLSNRLELTVRPLRWPGLTSRSLACSCSARTDASLEPSLQSTPPSFRPITRSRTLYFLSIRSTFGHPSTSSRTAYGGQYGQGAESDDDEAAGLMGSRSRPRRDKGKGKEREGTAGRGGEVRIEMSGLPPIWSVLHLTICTVRPADKSSPPLNRPSLLPGSIPQMRSRRSWTKPRRRVSFGHHRLRRPF